MLGTLYSTIRKLKRSNFPGHSLINQMYYDPKMVQLRLENLDYVVVDGFKFYMNDQIDSLQRVKGNSWFDGVRRGDIVVDIGANIGAIAIPLAKTAERVFAVEPLFYKELEANARLSGVFNITVLAVAIESETRFRRVEFSSRTREVACITFPELRDWVGRIDFLKLDCEGCEWDIKPEDLIGIRELRIEFHIRRGHKREDNRRLKAWLSWMDSAGYNKSVDYGVRPGPCVPFSDCVLVNASLEGAHEE